LDTAIRLQTSRAVVLVFQAGDGVDRQRQHHQAAPPEMRLSGIYFLDSNAAAAHHNVLTGLGYGLVDDGLFAIPVAHETAWQPTTTPSPAIRSISASIPPRR